LEESGHSLTSRLYPGMRLEVLSKSTKDSSQDNRCPGRYFNPGPSEYETGVLTTRPRRSVSRMLRRVAW